jgi:hypothetical protein
MINDNAAAGNAQHTDPIQGVKKHSQRNTIRVIYADYQILAENNMRNSKSDKKFASIVSVQVMTE